MRHLVSFLAIIIFLTACQPSIEGEPATSTNIPTATVEIPATSTVAPTQIPATPTATRDPNMPPDETGKDSATGLYTKTADDGKTTLYWEPIQYGTDVENGITGHWVESRMKDGPINLTGGGDSIYNDFTLNFTLYYASNFGSGYKVSDASCFLARL